MSNEISLCMIVKNEEKYLAKCLNSVKDIVDEIVIVDTGSKDKTVKIAETFGAKIYYFQWTNNFSEARNESLKYATKDWILIMDADDEFCIEDKDKFKELINNLSDENSLYYFETLNYCGNFVDSNNISINLNPRLFKNNHGFYYKGEVHNQLLNSSFKVKDTNYPIRIYHYGYLDESIKSKNKRNRNIELLKEQLRKNPNDNYANFNIGNEHFALGDMRKALFYYYKSYENFKPNIGYGFILFIRIVIANYTIGEYDKALEFADLGLQYYPPVTDLYFLKATIYKILNRPTLAIKSLEKCVELGDPPSDLKFLYGTWSFKALFELGNIYASIRDNVTAYNYYVETIRAKHDFVIPVFRIAHILKEEKTPLNEFKKAIENFFDEYPKAYQITADIFYNEGYYETALEYIEKSEKEGMSSESLSILRAKCLVRTHNFIECIDMKYLSENSAFYFYISMCKAISALFTNQSEFALSIVNRFHNSKLSNYNKKMLQVYTQFIKIYTGQSADVLSEDENEKEYTGIIMELCEILLINKMYNEFETALNLMNLISDKSILLQLGKLYYKYGLIDMAKKEVIRSIKEFEVFDKEGLDILKN